MKKDYFSINSEPVFQGQQYNIDPSEKKVTLDHSKQDEIESIRDSIKNEPALTGVNRQIYLRDWIETQKQNCSLGGNLSYTFAAALIAGPFAILGAFISGLNNNYGALYLILFGPIAEELLKQSGMIFMLEKKPYRLFTFWQFIAAAILSALIFAVIENLIYINYYVNVSNLQNPDFFLFWRWTICTLLHLTCSIIASFGLIRVWNIQKQNGHAAALDKAYPFFLTAIILHGIYNFTALVADKLLFPIK